ncbi:hypothetical protein RAD16_04780 [Bradyrhizobium sp. 18BD]
MTALIGLVFGMFIGIACRELWACCRRWWRRPTSASTQFVALLKGSRGHPEFGSGLRYAIKRGWLWMHESGAYLKLMPPGQDIPSS